MPHDVVNEKNYLTILRSFRFGKFEKKTAMQIHAIACKLFYEACHQEQNEKFSGRNQNRYTLSLFFLTEHLVPTTACVVLICRALQ